MLLSVVIIPWIFDGWINAYLHHEVSNAIIYPFPNFNDAVVEV